MNKPIDEMLRESAIQAVIQAHPKISLIEVMNLLAYCGPKGVTITAEDVQRVKAKIFRKIRSR